MGSRLRNSRTSRFERIYLGRRWCEALVLNDDRKLVARPLEPDDAEMLRRSFGELTAEEIRFRFLHPITELTPEHARALTRFDPENAFALVLVEAAPPEVARVGAVVRAVIDGSGHNAEIAIIVGREIGGFGLGAYMLSRVIEWSRKKRLCALYGDVMIENHRMLRLVRRLGFQFRIHPDEPQLIRVWRRLAPGPSPR